MNPSSHSFIIISSVREHVFFFLSPLFYSYILLCITYLFPGVAKRIDLPRYGWVTGLSEGLVQLSVG